MRNLSLFSGGGIGDYAAEQAGIATVAQCECDPACLFALKKLYPNTYQYKDVRDVTAESLRERGLWPIDIVSGGFPCQDISTAGKGEGITGKRSGLWVEMERIIGECRPRWVLAENVPALYLRGSDMVLADLEALGYTCWPLVVGAWSFGAPHKRDRVWIVARLDDSTKGGDGKGLSVHLRPRLQRQAASDIHGTGTGRGAAVADASFRGQRADGCACGDAGYADQRGEDVENAASARRADARPETGDRQREDTDAYRGFNKCESCDASQFGERGVGLADSSGGECASDGEPARRPRATAAPMRCRWPAGPGQPQHDWEEPRILIGGVGRFFDGVAERIHGSLGGGGNGIPPHKAASRANKSLLGILGNGWVPQIAEAIYRWIMEQEQRQ